MSAIELRPIEPTDWTRVHEWASSLESCRYQSWGPNTSKDTFQFAQAAVSDWLAVPLARRVWVAEMDSAVVGLGELAITDLDSRQGTLGYGVHLDHWGQGVATAIGTEIVRRAFAPPIGLRHLTATCDPRNIGSARVLQRIGMRLETRLINAVHLRDGWRDSDVYGLGGPSSST